MQAILFQRLDSNQGSDIFVSLISGFRGKKTENLKSLFGGELIKINIITIIFFSDFKSPVVYNQHVYRQRSSS